jgi:hypothetical protein
MDSPFDDLMRCIVSTSCIYGDDHDIIITFP